MQVKKKDITAKSVGNYMIFDSPIGKGQFATVYKAYNILD